MRLPGEEELVCGQRGQRLHCYDGPALSGFTSHWNKLSDDQQSTGETVWRETKRCAGVHVTKAVLHPEIWEIKLIPSSSHESLRSVQKGPQTPSWSRSQMCRTFMYSERRSITSVLLSAVSYEARSCGSRLTITQSQLHGQWLYQGQTWPVMGPERRHMNEREELKTRFTSLPETP